VSTSKSKRSRAEAAALLERAYAAGSAEAALAIANWLHYGIHYTRDQVRELELLRYAIAHEVTDAYLPLASYYEEGIPGVLRADSKKAFQHYVQAALAGDADAFMEVGRCYHYGIGTRKSAALAEIWLQAGEMRGGRFVARED